MKLHHANIVIGANGRGFVFEILENQLSFETRGNPDFLLVESESLGIDDARDLERWAMGKPLVGETKAALLIAASMTFESQNALLKILEEPPPGTYIFINLESLGGLLPTFLSRVAVLKSTEHNADEFKRGREVSSQDGAREFLHSKIKERLAAIRSLARKEDKSGMKELLKNLEIISYQDYKTKTTDEARAEAIKNILTAKVFSAARGSSPKMLLEWLACVI